MSEQLLGVLLTEEGDVRAAVRCSSLSDHGEHAVEVAGPGARPRAPRRAGRRTPSPPGHRRVDHVGGRREDHVDAGRAAEREVGVEGPRVA